MVASGVASKGLDFNDIQHVIIFSMPKEIEDYVHQIGRTGRSGKTGIATTFVNMNTPEQTLLDLKYLLMEAGQKWVFSLRFQVGFLTSYRVPPFLSTIDDPRAAQGGSLKGCTVCGGTSLIIQLVNTAHLRRSRSWSRNFELSETRGCKTKRNGFSSYSGRRRWLLIMCLYLLTLQSLFMLHFSWLP